MAYRDRQHPKPFEGGSDRPCFEFQRRGACKFGDRCRYSHRIGDERAGHITDRVRPSNPGSRPPSGGKLRDWKYLLNSQQSSIAPLVVGRFFQIGLELMEGDVGGAQEAIKLLATDEGLGFIKAVSDRHIPAANVQATRLTLWETEVKPMFSLVTHPRVVDSAVLEQQVASVFNFIFGVGGARMMRIFDFVRTLVHSLSSASASRMETIELSLAALSKVVDCNSTAALGPNFAQLVSYFTEAIQQQPSGPSEAELPRLQASKYLDYVRQRQEIAQGIPDLDTRPKPSSAREAFVLRRDLPGRLSAEGPRHDNDDADITKIKVMPTYEEIMSARGEYLPTNDPSQWHIKGIRGRLDREFRLVREDTVGQLRDAVRDMLELARSSKERGSVKTQSGNSLRTYSYNYPTAVEVTFDRKGGMEMAVRCNQLPAVRKLGAKQRTDWWMRSKRLQEGALVCMFDVTGEMLFCTVAETTMRNKDDKKSHKFEGQTADADQDQQSFTLSDDAESLYVNLRIVDASKNDIKLALEWYQNPRNLRRYLVEFPGVLLASFKHTLEALQRMHERPNVPFQSLLAPTENSSPNEEINAPWYARKAGFAFQLDSITNNMPCSVRVSQHFAPEKLEETSALDLTQSAALLNTLSRELSLIQGPPGTGKSYTGEKIVRVLLANKQKAELGPILCVCYTNHALDQLLEHLLDDGIEQIIRIGSRSKSERLQERNLRTVVNTSLRTKTEKSGLYEAERVIKEQVDEANSLLEMLATCDSWGSVKRFLEDEYPSHHTQLFGKTADDGFTMVDHQPHMKIKRWIDGGPRVSNPNRQWSELTHVPLQNMTYEERRRLHLHWVERIRDPLIAELTDIHDEYVKETNLRDQIRGDVDLRCLQQADIVGVTTTGLAKNIDLLRKLRCKVMLCEEAGEVLEAHLLTALLPSVEHGILIGDHLQLRPQIQNHDLVSTNPRGQQFSLDMSLFERLVNPPNDESRKVPYSVLETQRRMHPSIAELVRSTLYPSLKDDDRVKKYPGVVGVKKRLFWLHHENLEDPADGNDALGTSHSNSFEVEMTTALVSHLSRQGKYAPGDIAVITPYLGQLHRLRRRMEPMFDISVNDRDLGELDVLQDNATTTEASLPSATPRVSKTTLLKSVRVATVDNFQGEEAKVIVISLVRSNSQRYCGFLRTSNRINVLLSRAQHGMYIIGNSDTYSNVPMWAQVVKMLDEKDCLGTTLELQCPRHPDTPLPVSEPDHFARISPESGCNLPCDKRLHCGHSCPGRCHADSLHFAIKCIEPCLRLKKGCNHACPLRCSEPCHSKCQTVLRDVLLALPCGHSIISPRCWQSQDPGAVRCTALVTRTVPGCNHSIQVPCCEDVTSDKYQCTATCGHNRSCGHACESPCHSCNTRKAGKLTAQNHGVCQNICGRNYSTCRHNCAQKCHDGTQCKPCEQRCEVRCSHSQCSKACNEPCVPCAEATCASSCPHTQCTAPCAAPCNWVPCSLRCEKTLSCGHRCPSVCGETCPDSTYCQQCATQDIRSVCVDFLEMKEYHEVDLDQEPCIFPDCGHFLTVSSMDGQMDMSAHYTLNESGLPIEIPGESEPFSMDGKSIPGCATCRGSLRNISRYGRIIRRGMLDNATKRFIAWSNVQYLELAERLIKEQEALSNAEKPTAFARLVKKPGTLVLSGTRSSQLSAMRDYVGGGRYDSIASFWRRLHSYAGQVRNEEQPLQKVADRVRFANIQRGTVDQALQYGSSAVQVKGTLLASVLLLKCDIAVVTDFLELVRPSVSSIENELDLAVKLDLSLYLKECESLIQLARDTAHPREETQGHIFYAQLCISASFIGASAVFKELPSSGTSPDQTSDLRETGRRHVGEARKILERYPSVAVLESEIDAVETSLSDGEYRPVTAEELRQVYMASMAELSGTGHWYTCVNGHPFTINNCGMPMEEATCPECGARIGGQNHEAVDGVRHAAEIDELARDVSQLRV